MLLTIVVPVGIKASPVEIVDDFGHKIKLQKPAQRIISLYGAFNDLLLSLGAGESIVARTAADSDRPALAHLPSIGTHMRPNAELVLACKPDAVLQLAGRSEAMRDTEYLRELGLNVLVFQPDTFDGLFSVLEKLGQLTGREHAAKDLAESWRKRLSAIEALDCGEKPTVFYEARSSSLLGAGAKGIVNDIIEYAGGKNMLTIPKKLVRINEEILLAADPDAYIIQHGPMNPRPEPLEKRTHYGALKAVRNGMILSVEEKTFARPGPASVDAAEELAQWLCNRTAKTAKGQKK